jgi:hypothetical protein
MNSTLQTKLAVMWKVLAGLGSGACFDLTDFEITPSSSSIPTSNFDLVCLGFGICFDFGLSMFAIVCFT